MTAEGMLARRKGQAFNAEEALATRQILARSATDLINMARQIQRTDVPGDELEASFRESWLRHVAIQEQVAGATAEAGRVLSQFRMAAYNAAAGRVLPPVVNSGGIGPDLVSPVYTSTDRKDALVSELLSNGATVSRPQRGDLTPQQYDSYQELSGKLVRQALEPVIGGPVWSSLSAEDRQDFAEGAIRRARRSARETLRISKKGAGAAPIVPGGVPAADPWATFPNDK